MSARLAVEASHRATSAESDMGGALCNADCPYDSVLIVRTMSRIESLGFRIVVWILTWRELRARSRSAVLCC